MSVKNTVAIRRDGTEVSKADFSGMGVPEMMDTYLRADLVVRGSTNSRNHLLTALKNFYDRVLDSVPHEVQAGKGMRAALREARKAMAKAEGRK